MSNETQTHESQPESAQGSNGFDNVAAQYRAMQEAQLLHEETINQLREEVRGQREKLAELANANPAAKTGQVDVVMLRLSELERKIGEGAPDPLINEIAHRLAALENEGPMRGAKDPRVDEALKQIEGLRQKIETAGGKDSRTDDVVLRIASLEGAFRRAAQSRDPEEVQARMDALAEELRSRQESELDDIRAGFTEVVEKASEAAAKIEDNASTAEALDALAERMSKVEQQLGGLAPREQLTAFGEQLAELDRKLAAQNVDEIDSRVRALEERPAPQLDATELEEISNRVEAVEHKLAESDAGSTLEQLQKFEVKLTELESLPQVTQLEQRIESLASQVGESDASQRLLELAGRLRSLENRLDEAPEKGGDDVSELSARLSEVEQATASKASLIDLNRLQSELRSIQTDAGPARGSGDAPPADLTARLDELEKRIVDAESSSRLEDAHARLKDVEEKWAALGDPADIGRRLTVIEMDDKAADPRVDELLQRLTALEEKPFESVSDERLQELSKTVSDLRAELETVSQDRMPALTELPSRLSSLEAQVRELAARPAGEGSQPEGAAELRSELEGLAQRIEQIASQPSAPANDPRVSELIARIDWVERQAATAAEPSSAGLAELRTRLEQLEQGTPSGEDGEGLSAGARAEIAARLSALEEALAAQGQQGQGTGDVEALLHQETERWNQWARSTVEEIGELRDQLGKLGGASTPGIDPEALEAIGIQISNGLNNSEVRSLRAQMYFVYLSIGVLWALILYLLIAG